ncbi:MAG: ABC transporter substrate-binding protein [Chloroflexota bacterium]
MLMILGAVACGFGGQTPTPTTVVPPTPAPRPTAEPPAAVTAWYLGAQAAQEEPVRIRAALTASEIDRIKQLLARRYPELETEWTAGADVDLFQATAEELRSGAPTWDIYIGESAPRLKTARAALRWTPPEARTIPPELSDSEGGWYSVAAIYHVMQYSTEQVPPPYVPKSYEALLDPGYFGRLAIEELQLVWLHGLVQARGQDSAAALVRGLAGQGVTFRKDTRTLVAFVTAGEHAIGIDARLEAVEREMAGGGKTDWVAVEPVTVEPLGMAVSATTDRPNGARLVANYLLSMDVQQMLLESGRVPARRDVDADPDSRVRDLKTQIVLPPTGPAEAELRTLWNDLWGRR